MDSDTKAQIDALRRDVERMQGYIDKLQTKVDETAASLDSFSITDDTGIFSGQGPNGITANFSNLPDPVVTAVVDCDVTPPTVTITVTSG